MSKKLISLCLLLLCCEAFAFQKHMRLKIATPLIQDVSLWSSDWKPGDFATYTVFSDQSMEIPVGKHSIRILEEKFVAGEQMLYFKITREESDAHTSLSFWLPAKTRTINLVQSSDIVAETSFGKMNVRTPGTAEAEILDRLESEDTEHGKAYRIRYSGDSQDATVWVGNKIGPYGILKGQFWKDGELRFYQLDDYQDN